MLPRDGPELFDRRGGDVRPKLKATISIGELNRRLVRRLVMVDDQSGNANMLALALGPTFPTLIATVALTPLLSVFALAQYPGADAC